MELTERWLYFKEALEKAAYAWCEAMRSTYEAIKEFCEAFRKAAWETYLRAGAPYGETDDGLWRWLRERAEVERLRREADDIEIRHRDMAAFRAMVKEKEGK